MNSKKKVDFYYKVFAALEDAKIQFKESVKKNNYKHLMLLAKDIYENDGKKRFVVTYFDYFANYYLNEEKCQEKCYYEVR